MIAEQTEYFEDEYEYEMLPDEEDFVLDNPQDEDEDFGQQDYASRWTLRRLIITLILLVIAAAIVVFVLLPLIEGWINPAIPLNLPTPIKA